MKHTVVLYGSTMGNTENAAKLIAAKIDADIFSVDSFDINQIESYKNIILGSSTWGIGDLQDDWEGFITPLSNAPLKGKTIAIFGLGDAMSYDSSFVDAMGIIYAAVKDKGAKIVGTINTADYDFVSSRAVVDGQLVGLALDEDNEHEKTEERVNNWVKIIQKDFQ